MSETSSSAESEKLAVRLLAMMKEVDANSRLTNREISDAVVEKVWGSMKAGSPGELLLDEFISRFDKLCGIKRDDLEDQDEVAVPGAVAKDIPGTGV